MKQNTQTIKRNPNKPTKKKKKRKKKKEIHRKPQSLYDSDLVEREIERIKRKKRVDKQTLLQEREKEVLQIEEERA